MKKVQEQSSPTEKTQPFGGLKHDHIFFDEATGKDHTTVAIVLNGKYVAVPNWLGDYELQGRCAVLPKK